MNHKAAWLLAACLANATPLVWSDEIALDRTYAVAPGGRLTVRAEAGDIKVAGTESSQVVVHIVARGSRRILDRMTLTADQAGDDVAVVAKRSGGGLHWFDWIGSRGDSDIKINIVVPHHYHVDLLTSGGDIDIKHVQGTANGKTSGGDVRLDDIRGAVTFKSSGGDMNVATVQGAVDLITSGGNIEGRSVTGDFNASTSGGEVRVESIGGNVKLRTTGGDVTAARVTGPIEAHTSGGVVRLTQIDGAIKARTSGGDVRVELVGANRGINVSTSGGEIIMQVSPGIAATLQATSNGGRIRSDLPMTTISSGDSHLSGTINGGGETIDARTSGGNILLRARTVSTEQPLERS